jgi:D-serine deaminase-like pyridoxal phosphate-dependent protein
MALADVDTPALLVDLDAFESNLELMSTAAEEAGVRLRPHAKTHKCAVIAQLQIAGGAVGVCCQKVSEAETLVDHGIRDILISNEVVGSRKLDRLAVLATRARLAVCVDDLKVIDALAEAARRVGAMIEVLVEVDVGGDRCGVDPGTPALALAGRVASWDNLRFRGLQAYQGRAQHIRDYAERKAAIDRVAAAVHRTREVLARRGLTCEIVSGGGTGTYPFEIATGACNELQVGSYIFMDANYRLNCNEGGMVEGRFRQSLHVYTQVMSMPGRGYAIVDAGLKAIALDSGMPLVEGMPDVSYCRPSDEHGMLDIRARPDEFRLGAKLNLIPGHCDPTVNMYDWYVAVRRERVEALWPIVARGALS